jgi:hypothetical protein
VLATIIAAALPRRTRAAGQSRSLLPCPGWPAQPEHPQYIPKDDDFFGQLFAYNLFDGARGPEFCLLGISNSILEDEGRGDVTFGTVSIQTVCQIPVVEV